MQPIHSSRLRRAGWTTFALAAAAVLSVAATPRARAAASCALARPGADQLGSDGCRQCHPSSGPLGACQHPVDADLASAAARRPLLQLRPAAEVVKRGVFLAGGAVSCLSCHDGASPWRSYLALPPGAAPAPRVDRRDPATYEPGPALAAKTAALARDAAAGLRPAAAMKPLCLGCHAAD